MESLIRELHLPEPNEPSEQSSVQAHSAWQQMSRAGPRLGSVPSLEISALYDSVPSRVSRAELALLTLPSLSQVAYGFWTDAGGASVYSVGAFSVYTLDARFSIHSNKSSSLTLTALSSTEWEYMALFHALKELIWLHRFLKEIGYDVSKQNTIYCDNQGAIALAHNPEHHARTKHIDIQYHFVRNCVEYGTMRLEYCPTEDIVADGLTKALRPQRHWKLAKMMGMGVWTKRMVEKDLKDQKDQTKI